MAKKTYIKAKRYVFTLNNYTETEENRLKDMDCEWLIFGHEKGEQGTKHLQGAMTFEGRRSLNAIKKLFPRMHIEVMKGSPQASKDYCTKEDATGYFEKGICPTTAKVSKEANTKKWNDAFDAAKEGRFKDIPRDMWIRYQNSFKQIYFDHAKDASMEAFNDKDLKDHFLWLWGPTGTGKSHSAHRIAKEIDPDNDPYLKDLNKWWNGYEHQRVTIIEEADPKRCEHLASFFKKWADKWAFTAECKGTVIPACRPEYIIVTSNYSIQECFPEPADTVPLERRFTQIELVQSSLAQHMHVNWPENIAPKPMPANQTKSSDNQTNNECGRGPRAPGNTIPAPSDVACATSSPHEEHSGSTREYEVSQDSPINEEEVIDILAEERAAKRRKVVDEN